MFVEKNYLKRFILSDGEKSEIIECGVPQMVIYSVEFDSNVEAKAHIFQAGKRYVFSCISDTASDIEEDVIADLVWRFDCYDDDGDEMAISLSGIKEKSIKIEFQKEIRL